MDRFDEPIKIDAPLLQRVFSLIDLTSLNETDSEASIAAFCEKARNTYGHVAAVCVYPPFVRMVAAEFSGSPIKTATVANFPHGDGKTEAVLLEISRALSDGAQEIDVVFPYKRYLAGEKRNAQVFVEVCKAACGDQVTLKVILETGALRTPTIIAEASADVLRAGADFVKTSTGKMTPGATIEAATNILTVIKDMQSQLHRRVGLKVAGGIKEIQQAVEYITLADRIMGRDWVTPTTFRIGASRLVDEMISLQ